MDHVGAANKAEIRRVRNDPSSDSTKREGEAPSRYMRVTGMRRPRLFFGQPQPCLQVGSLS